MDSRQLKMTDDRLQKLSTTQKKQTTQNTAQQNYPGSVDFYHTRPRNEVGLFYSSRAHTSETLAMFKSRLKTDLFAVSYIHWTIAAVAHLTLFDVLVVTFTTLQRPVSCFIIIYH